ncbi:MAG: hypothetical protein WA766_21530 [Candidatus Acidiferrales bacterium]
MTPLLMPPDEFAAVKRATDWLRTMPEDFTPDEFAAEVIIVWPQPASGSLPGGQAAILDSATGQMITSVIQLEVRCSASGIIWARARMFAAADGTMLRSGSPRAGPDGTVALGTYALHVTEMRLATSPGSAWPDEVAAS